MCRSCKLAVASGAALVLWGNCSDGQQAEGECAKGKEGFFRWLGFDGLELSHDFRLRPLGMRRIDLNHIPAEVLEQLGVTRIGHHDHGLAGLVRLVQFKTAGIRESAADHSENNVGVPDLPLGFQVERPGPTEARRRNRRPVLWLTSVRRRHIYGESIDRAESCSRKAL